MRDEEAEAHASAARLEADGRNLSGAGSGAESCTAAAGLPTSGSPKSKACWRTIDGWIRRKLRALLWRQWKRTYTRAKNLMRAGIDEVRAWRSATNQRGPWWNGGASHMNAAYRKSWFDRMGLVSLLDARQRLTSAS